MKKEWCKHIINHGDCRDRQELLEVWGEKGAGWFTVYNNFAKQFMFCPICGKRRPK